MKITKHTGHLEWLVQCDAIHFVCSVKQGMSLRATGRVRCRGSYCE